MKKTNLIWVFLLGVPAYGQWFQGQSQQLTPADSLATFRPDSVDANRIKRLEAGVKTDSTRKNYRADSSTADSLKLLLELRRPYIGVHVGVGFLDLKGKEKFEKALSNRATKENRNVLQPYESVHLFFPAGLVAGTRVLPLLDVVAKTHSLWYRQNAVLGKSGSTSDQGQSDEDFFVVQAHLAGLGLKMYLPMEILMARGHGNLYLEAIRYFTLPGTEIYSSTGSARAKSSPFGEGFELQMGFLHDLNTRIAFAGALSFLSTTWSSDKPWEELAPGGGNSHVTWGGSALQVRLFWLYNFGFHTQPSQVIPVKTGPLNSSVDLKVEGSPKSPKPQY